MTAREAWRAAAQRMQAAGVEDADFDAVQLVRFVTGLDGRSEAEVTPEQLTALEKLVDRRCAREPLQYLLGEWDFLDLTLTVGPGVLIPRADTELVAQQAMEAAGAFEAPRVADLCSGSGAIALGVARHVPGAQVTAVEISPQALAYLQENNRRCGSPLAVVQADVFCWREAVPDESFDVIVSNPPYITASEMETLAPELDFEPRMALEAPENGLAFYRHIAPAYFSKLSPGGALVFEIGWQQGQAVAEICRQAGYTNVKLVQDLEGRDRCVRARRP